ncbi:MAG: hypothetical protein BWY64_00820 [bacterium ADurb.Bin363]|nr:MAG: hypothetical protein BWY64_00820 [bacterium ADurb.Bin363]
MSYVANRRELVFLYDVTNSNPNGDPIDENKPRIDEESRKNLVSDVRLKRTIRDYLQDFRKKVVFIVETRKEDGNLKTKEDRQNDLNINSAKDLIDNCIDIRLFGATNAIKGKTIIYTGPVQFKFGVSLHKVETKYIKGTTVMPSAEGKSQGTFTEQHILPYSLISFYGIVNENAAKDTKLSEEDLVLLYDGIWNGTKNLISRSKIGQMPRFLLEVVYNENNYHIGDLDKQIKLVLKENRVGREEEIRSTEDYYLNLAKLKKTLEDNLDKIKEIKVKIDPNLEIKEWFTSHDKIKNFNIGG